MIREYSAGGVVYRKSQIPNPKSQIPLLRRGFGGQANSKFQIRWLLIKPKGKERWQLPKGLIDKGESAEEAALREVKEEGGVEAKIIKKIDTIKIFFHYNFPGAPEDLVFKTITFFLMEYLQDTKEGPDYEVEIDKVVWLPFSEAYKRLTFPSEKKILKKAWEECRSG